jgi:hypothetical protein
VIPRRWRCARYATWRSWRSSAPRLAGGLGVAPAADRRARRAPISRPSRRRESTSGGGVIAAAFVLAACLAAVGRFPRRDSTPRSSRSGWWSARRPRGSDRRVRSSPPITGVAI